MGKRILAAAALMTMLAGAAFLTSCSKESQGTTKKGAGDRPIPVTAAVVTTKAIPVTLNDLIGTVEAHSTVWVKAEVAGTLTAVHFQKGQSVKKNDLLFEIDPRTYLAALAQAQGAKGQAEAAVAQAQATLVRDQVQEANARKTVARQADLLKKGMAPQVDYDKSITDADALAATVHADEAAIRAGEAAIRADEAAIEVAKLQVERCKIYSPIDGKAGNILVDEGNLIKVTDVPLVCINQVSPIDVVFPIPQKDLPLVKKYMTEGTVQVKVLFAPEAGGPESGDLTFIDNAVDQSSRTIKLGATFQNKDERLWPGAYVDVTLVLTVQKDAVVVPAKAVQSGRDSKYVYVIQDNGTVKSQAVTTGTASGEDLIVTQGLVPGQRVVTDGQFRLVEGSPVEIKGEGAADAPTAEKGTAEKGAAKKGPKGEGRKKGTES